MVNEIAFKVTCPDGAKRHVTLRDAQCLLERRLTDRFGENRDHACAFLEAMTGKRRSADIGRQDCANVLYYLEHVSLERLQHILAKGDPGETYVEIRIKLRLRGEATAEHRRRMLENARAAFERSEIAPPGLKMIGLVVLYGEEIGGLRKTQSHGHPRSWSLRRPGISG